jgi:dimethylamine--corrinoid protein Co-methyltransferase
VGVGDPFGMAVTHAIASGMGGMRTAGDLVARTQISRGMKLGEAKKYVADRLGVSVSDLTDPIIMREVREDLNLGLLHPNAGSHRCMEAKFNIARLLDIDINCVRGFVERTSI